MTTQIVKDGGLWIRANFSRAEDIIQYSDDRGETWDYSTLQVANARHDKHAAIEMVREWLDRR
jgi:hypothetical protein